MGINVRQKGAEGEREVARALNSIVRTVAASLNRPVPVTDVIQRNQNQSAVGGSDLTNPFKISFEVKRQETPAINTWWAQCEAAANRTNELPVLVYRFNGNRNWRVIMYAHLDGFAPVGYNKTQMRCRAEVSWDEFLQWFYHWVRDMLLMTDLELTK